MQPPWQPVVTIIVGVAGVVIAMVGPLYYLVLNMRSGDARADEVRSGLSDAQGELEAELSGIEDEISSLREEVAENAVRIEENQQHIHQLLVGEYNGDDDEIGNPHYTAEHCPLPDECPFCTPDGS